MSELIGAGLDEVAVKQKVVYWSGVFVAIRERGGRVDRLDGWEDRKGSRRPMDHEQEST